MLEQAKKAEALFVFVVCFIKALFYVTVILTLCIISFFEEKLYSGNMTFTVFGVLLCQARSR